MQASTPLPLGSLLAGKYRLDALLGQGGMGAVYLAENVDLGLAVAIKVLHADLAGDEHLLARFRQEARAAAAIGHPGIVAVLDLGTTDDGSAFLVMERLQGETLGSRIDRQKQLPVAEVAAIAEQVLSALQAVHQKGITHRDLKPDNVFLCERPLALVKILDFGISKLRGVGEDLRLTQTGVLMGTPCYMPPEQARGARDVGPTADLYALGALLYHALAGVPPFDGDSLTEVLSQVLLAPHRPLESLRPDVPLGLSAWIDCLLAKRPEVRPPSAEEALGLLRDALGGSWAGATVPGESGAAHLLAAPTLAAPATTVAPTGSHRRALGIALWAFALVSAGGGGLLFLAHRRHPQGGAGTTAAPVRAASSAASAPAAAAVRSAPEGTATRATVTLVLVADAPDARFAVDGEALDCRGTCPITRPAGARVGLVVTAAGRKRFEDELRFEHEGSLPIRLPRRAASHPPPSAPPADRGVSDEDLRSNSRFPKR
jgi:hypothetical protein